MSDEKPAREPIHEDARIDALEARLQAAREREEQRNRPTVKGTDANRSNKLMQLRVLLQAVAIILIMFTLWLTGGGR